MPSMRLIALGLNHRTAPVEIRERFSLSRERIIEGLDNLQEYEPLQEAVVLSTCNRSELYVAADLQEGALEAAQNFWADLTGNKEKFEDFQQYTYTFLDDACIHHLLQVASSLDSLVIGEGQILSQVKHAYSIAKDAGATSTVLNLLFHRAITTGKRVRTETKIAFNPVSVSYTAVELAKNIFGRLDTSSALLIGAGKMAELTATHMVSHGVKELYVANRHVSRADELSKKFNATALSLGDVFQQMIERKLNVDIVVTSTGAPDYVIREKDIVPFMATRDGRPLVLIDIAVPRDVEPSVADIPGVTLYNIDDLEAVVDENLQERKQEAVQAEKIVVEEMDSLLDRFNYLPVQPVLAKLSDKAEEIRLRELKRALAKMPELTEAEKRAMEKMSHMLVRKMLRLPMMKVTDAAGRPCEQFYVRALNSLFELE